MEWIDGDKLTDVTGTASNTGEQSSTVEENLALVKVAIDSTLSQLLVEGILHADPHAGNLLKVKLEDGSVTLGYLDFGIVSTIPEQVRDALICSVALQVFSRDVDAVSSLFGELRLIPQHILDDDEERAALAEALEITFENSLLYPEATAGEDDTTAIPDLKFDKLLDSLSRLVPRFQFDLPPYFINNARALSTLEGIAKSLDPSFNVLTIMYPYALSRLLKNPSKSEVVARTLQSLIRSEDGKIDRTKIRRLLRDSALISGQSKRRVVWDVLKTKEGRILTRGIVGEEVGTYFGRNDRKRNAKSSSNKQRRKMKKKRWYYLDL
jgi:predicted unusual protein kinase regulating ubiquinone biosynthesis (AarF/ABC1/UbiB family)